MDPLNLSESEASASNDNTQDKEHANNAKRDGARPKLHSMIDVVTNLGYSPADVHQAVEDLRARHEDISWDSLIDTTAEIQHMSLMDPAYISENAFRHKSDVLVRSTPPDDPDTDSAQDKYRKAVQIALSQKKLDLRDSIDALQYRCRICNDADANILLLPCAHFVCCSSCMMDVRRCPLPRCNKIVRGTKEVFFA